MTLKKRLWAGAACFACIAAMSSAAAAATPHALSNADAEAYVAAFQDVDRGDFIDAQMQASSVKDKSLLGYLTFSQLMHPTAHKAAFDELTDWLARFRDLPVADRIFSLAAKRKPADAPDPPQPAIVIGTDASRIATPPAASERAQKARDAFFAGDVQRALDLAPAAGERLIAGLSAFRLARYDRAEGYFAELARDQGQDAWTRSEGAFWAARSADARGEHDKATIYLRAAAQSPDTFYGMIAERKLKLGRQAGPPTIDSLIQASYTLPPPEVSAFVAQNDRAHRAAALAQIGRLQECGEELRAGLALARTEDERSRWAKLAATLGVPTVEAPVIGGGPRIGAIAAYPTPELTPVSGFTLDKALVYAIVRQESAFNPGAVSPKGAVGLMQLMPDSAARMAGDERLKSDISPLFDPGYNLRLGQDYVAWLMDRGVGPDLLKVVAAYNGGPGLVLKTSQLLGSQADDLMLIESLPAFETRAYVQKVVAGYWTYRRLFGEATPTLDALASGARQVDARLDLTETGRATAQGPAQVLQIGMR
jgi:soluble lytic murein transglycosylase-like protein